MRWIALSLLAAVLLAGCGGGSETTYTEVNSGVEPGISPARERARLEHQVEKRNDGAKVACFREESATELNPWECKVRPVGQADTAEIEVLGPGFAGQYKIAECRTSPDQGYSQEPRGVCKQIQ
jgi:hypothetical protein